jgi:hypothetical protein
MTIKQIRDTYLVRSDSKEGVCCGRYGGSSLGSLKGLEPFPRSIDGPERLSSIHLFILSMEEIIVSGSSALSRGSKTNLGGHSIGL